MKQLITLNFACEGCAVKNMIPQHCGNCQNLIGDTSKYQPLIKNYLLLNNVMLSNDAIATNSVLNKIYKNSIKELWISTKNN